MNPYNLEQLLYAAPGDSLATFLLTGALGVLNSQPTIGEVRQLLGEPIHIERQIDVIPNEELLTLDYTTLQFTYIGGKFYQMAIYFREYAELDHPIDLPSALGLAWYPLLKQLDQDSFKLFLSTRAIECRQVIFAWSEPEVGHTIEITQSGIWLSFYANPTNNIDSIHHTPSRPGQWEYAPVDGSTR